MGRKSGGSEKYRNIYDSMRDSAVKYSNKTAVIQEDRSITYQSLLLKTDIMAGWLKQEFGIKKGDRVGLMFVNCIDFYIAFYAVVKIGAIAVMVNTKMQSNEISFILEDTQTHCVIANVKWMEKIKAVAERVGITRVLTDTKCREKAAGIRICSMEEIFSDTDLVEREFEEAEREENLTAVILHTSGTTGKPKGIMVSHTNIMGTAYGYQEVLDVTEKDLSVLSVPVFHILALSCVSNLFFYIGATIVVFERFDANKVLEAIEQYHATHFHSVPAVYIKMMNEAVRKYNLDSLKVAVCGGAVISEENKKRLYQEAPNASFRIAYGLTETAGSGVLSPAHGAPGREVFNCRICVRDERGNISDTGEGEAVCEGEIVTTRVWGRENTESGRLFTGDIIRKERNGDIFILDRIKDVINRGGEKLFPSSIENILLQYPGVEQAVVFPVKHDVYGEVPAAVLVSKNEEKICIREIQEDLPGKLGKFEIPDYLEVWDQKEIPVTGNGKVRKRALRDIFEKRLERKGGKDEKA